MTATEEELNLFDVPLMALRSSTRQIIVNELNKKKVLASEEGFPRDWRGLAHLTGVLAPPGDSPAANLLTAWEKEASASVGQLELYLGQLDRWDIVDDMAHLIRDDAKQFTGRMTEDSTPKLNAGPKLDDHVLTFDDIGRLEHGLELQVYDALLLYADQDREFAKQMVDKLENDYDLKVCMKEDLVGGLSFEHQGVMRLISERCRRVIIIVSRSFVSSPVNQFFVTFAQALAIEQRRRIIIPCMYERDHFTLPMEINYLHKLDYNRVGLRHYDFWELLRASVTSPPAPPPLRNSSVTVCELTNSTQEQLQLRCSQKAIKPASENVMVSTSEKFKMATQEREATCKHRDTSSFNSSYRMLPSSENHSSSALLNPSLELTCSTLSLPDKKCKSKSPTAILRKLFRTDAGKGEKKSKKLAVRL